MLKEKVSGEDAHCKGKRYVRGADMLTKEM